VLRSMQEDKVDTVVVVPLYPHFSVSTSGSSLKVSLACVCGVVVLLCDAADKDKIDRTCVLLVSSNAQHDVLG
jgi:hypothetical protein